MTTGRALVVSLDQLGDLVFASALVPALRRWRPELEVDLWCREHFRDVGALIPGVTELFSVQPFWIDTMGARRGSRRDLLRVVRAIRGRRHDTAILASAPWRTAAAVALTRIPMRIGHARHRNRLFLTHVVAAADDSRPVVAEEARLLGPLGIRETDLATSLDATRLGRGLGEVRQLLGTKVATLHAFAVDRRRCVAVSQWVQVAEELARRGFTICWVGTRRELDEVRGHDRGERWRYADRITGGTIGDLATILAASSLFVGHDSGPLHVANALGVPAVGVFAPGQPERTFPQGPGAWRLVRGVGPDAITASMIVDAVDGLSDEATIVR